MLSGGDGRGLEAAPALSEVGRAPSRAVYLHPAQIFASREPAAVTTILGSCVSVCAWDRVSGVGGVNHFLLPCGESTGDSPLRFGNLATGALIRSLLDLGASRRGLAAKVFGGACIAEAFARTAGRHLGAQNVTWALLVLGQERVPVEAQDTDGRQGRKLIFHTDDGSAWVKGL